MNKPYVAFGFEELRALLTETVKALDTRCHVLFLLCVSHGLRITEALTLTKANFVTTGGKLFLTVERLKGSQTTCDEVASNTDPLLDEFTIVSQYLATLEGDALFTLTRFGADYLIKLYGKRAGLPTHKLSMHKFKHTLGTLMRKSGADVVQIKNALGHTDIRSTMQYLRPSADEIQQARIRALSGVFTPPASVPAPAPTPATPESVVNSRTMYERPATIYERVM